MHHLEEEKFYFLYMYYFNIFSNALRNYDTILRTFQSSLVYEHCIRCQISVHHYTGSHIKRVHGRLFFGYINGVPYKMFNQNAIRSAFLYSGSISSTVQATSMQKFSRKFFGYFARYASSVPQLVAAMSFCFSFVTARRQQHE